MLTNLCNLTQQASGLLEHSGALLQRVQQIAATGKATGQQFTSSLPRLMQLDSLHHAIVAGRQVARQAAASALEIRALIGDPHGVLQRYSWTSATPGFTMTELEQHLATLSSKASQAVDAWSGSKSELAALEQGLLTMTEIARSNIAVATAAASASEKLHLVAMEFVKEVEQ